MPHTTALVEFKRSTIHGTGAFARQQIAPGTHLLEYAGERISKSESVRRCASGNDAIFYLDEEWDLDGAVATNLARYLNHSCAPNCEVLRLRDSLWIVTRREVQAGEELTFDYGYGLEELAEHPCACRALDCVGYIVAADYHELVRRRSQWAREGAEPGAAIIDGELKPPGAQSANKRSASRTSSRI